MEVERFSTQIEAGCPIGAFDTNGTGFQYIQESIVEWNGCIFCFLVKVQQR